MSGGERFTLLTSEDPELPETFRVRISPPPFATKKKFQLLLSVVWQYSKLANLGMPKETVIEHMDQLESVLTPAFEKIKEGFLAVVSTGSGVREWQFYVRDSDRAIEIVNTTL